MWTSHDVGVCGARSLCLTCFLRFSFTFAAHSEDLMWTEVYYSFPVSALIFVSPLYLQWILYTVIVTRAFRCPIQAFSCCHGYHFHLVSISQVLLERGNLPSPLSLQFLYSFQPLFFPPLEDGKKILSFSWREWLFLLLFFLSDSFTHSVWHQQSPLLLLSTVSLTMCILPQAEGLSWRKLKENVHLLLILTAWDHRDPDSSYVPKFP